MFVAGCLVVVGMAGFFSNINPVINGDAVECGHNRMQPDDHCVYGGGGGEGASYEEVRATEARQKNQGYLGIGIGALGLAIFAGRGVVAWAGYRKPRRITRKPRGITR